MVKQNTQEIDIDKLVAEIDDLKNREGQTVVKTDRYPASTSTAVYVRSRTNRPSWKGKVSRNEIVKVEYDERFKCGR